MLGPGDGLTCKDGFVGFELLPSDIEAAVSEARTLPQVPQIIRQLTLWDLQHVHVGLARNVNRVLDNAYLCTAKHDRENNTLKHSHQKG